MPPFAAPHVAAMALFAWRPAQALHLDPLAAVLLVAAILSFLWQRHACIRQTERLRRTQRELAAFGAVDLPRPSSTHLRLFAREACRVAAQTGPFRRSALLLPDHAGRLTVAGRAAVNDLAVTALETVAARIPRTRPSRSRSFIPADPTRTSVPPEPLSDAFTVTIERRRGARSGEPSAMCCRDALFVPLWSSSGDLLGAFVLCGTLAGPKHQQLLQDALTTLQLLTHRVASLLERAHLADRLDRTQRSHAPSQRTASRSAVHPQAGAAASGPSAPKQPAARQQHQPAS